MIQFVKTTSDISTALSGSYNAVLVIVSIAVACFASYAGLLISERIKAVETARARWVWLGNGAVAMGLGVWAMHFIGMLAFRLPVPVAYDFGITLASAVPAILASAVALFEMGSDQARNRRYLFAGVILGAGIGVMHYTGMMAMRLNADMQYDPGLFALSILVAVGLGITAFYVHDLSDMLSALKNKNTARAVGSVLMGLAIGGMHYTAMSATYFFPVADQGPEQMVIGSFWLSVGVAAITTFIILLAVIAAMVDRRLRSAVQFVRITRKRLVEAVESISDGFILFDGGGNLVICNNVFRGMYPSLNEILQPGISFERVLRAWSKLLNKFPGGVSAEEYVAHSLRDFQEGNSVSEGPEEAQLSDGRWMYIRQRSMESGGVVGVWTDITPVKELQDVYKNRANHDLLTGLPNRQLFEDRLEHVSAHAKRLEGTVALLYVDLDGFKPINDTLGHDAGDIVLIEVARRLQRAARESDTVARLGGDEFAVILEPRSDADGAEVAARRILKTLLEPISANNQECTVGASIGIAISPTKAFDKAEIVKRADTAMYEAKKAGGNCFRVHTI